MKQTAKYFLLSAIILASMTQVYCFAFADEMPDKAVETVWTSPELDGEVLELFFSPDTTVCYPEKALIFRETYWYKLVYFNSGGGIVKTTTLAAWHISLGIFPRSRSGQWHDYI